MGNCGFKIKGGIWGWIAGAVIAKLG